MRCNQKVSQLFRPRWFPAMILALVIAPSPSRGQVEEHFRLGTRAMAQGDFNEDFSLNKRTRLTERTDILFSTDFLNAFNRHVFARPITSGRGDINGFGVIQTTAYPSAFTNSNSFGRIIQFTLKVEF